MVPIVLFAAPTIRRLGSAITLVRVRAVGINFADTLMRQSKYAVTPELPAIPGTEVAGTVEGLGDGVSGLTIGARAAVPLFANRYVGRRLC